MLTDEQPFEGISDDWLSLLVGQQFLRLRRPTSKAVESRGLTDKVWAVITEASDPNAQRRPEFDALCKTIDTIISEREAERRDPLDDLGIFGSFMRIGLS